MTSISDSTVDSSAPVATPLDGRVTWCECPDCGSPLAVRMWLMTADCWQCGLSISLSLLPEFESSVAVRPRTRGRREPQRPRSVAGRSESKPAPSEVRKPSARHGRPVGPPRFARTAPRTWRSLLEEVLACLLSIAAHLLLLILLALLTLAGRDEDHRQIHLSLEVSPERIAGGIPNEHEVIQRIGFELPVDDPPEVEPNRDALEAQQWARELQAGKAEPEPNLPELRRLQDALESDDRYRRMHAARDPRIRMEVVLQEGGTTLTEAAVARALRWIARHQQEDGSWQLDAFHRAPGCDGRCRDRGRIRSGAGGTALALQAMLGAGQTHQLGMYRDVVSHGLQYLVAIQQPDGDLRGDSHTNAGMYVHAIATIVLCDALALTGDETLRDPAQRAIHFIAAAQHKAGGWRYRPGQEGDTSVIGWQLMALHTARAASLDVPSAPLLGASAYLDAAQVDKAGAFYAYRPGGRPTAAMTAEGLLSRMYLGRTKDDPGLRYGVPALLTEFPPDGDEPNIYYWYYGTQVMHHWGGPWWEKWNRRMRELLVSTQVTRGHEAGSWDPDSPHGHQGGRLYMTALACCTLEVYYRHAPLFRKIQLD